MASVTTPQKQPNRICLSCSSSESKLITLSGRKVCEDRYFLPCLESIIDVSLEKIKDCLYVCRKCHRFIDSYLKFKHNARKVSKQVLLCIQRPKREARTPHSSITKRRHVESCDTLIKSVEKIKICDSKHHDPVSQLNVQKCLFPLHKPSENETITEGIRPLVFTPSSLAYVEHVEHGYNKTEIAEVSQSEKSSKTISLAEKTVIEKHDMFPSLVAAVKEKCKQGNSVLSKTTTRNLSRKDIFASAVLEFQSTCPALFAQLSTALGNGMKSSSKITTLGTMYGMILHSRSNKISAIQRIFTSLAIRYHADNRLLSVLNKAHFTLSDKSKDHLTDSFASHSEERIIQKLASGQSGKLNGDNLDLHVTTNDVRMANRSKDYHFFATDFVFDRVETSHLDEHSPLQDFSQCTADTFLPNANEVSQFCENVKILLARKIAKHCKEFAWMDKVLPEHIPHEFQDQMSTPSEIFMLPILLKNEASHSDCLAIMESYVKWINSWYAKAGRGSELQTLQVPVGGDQLTRVRLQAAKAMREGTHTRQDRLEQLDPIIVELFHTLQDFLEKLCKKFLKLDMAKDKGTLGNLKMEVQRSNVNGKVKVRFKAHEQFVDTVGTAYLLRLVMDIYGMAELTDSPSHPDIPDNIKFLHRDKKEQASNQILATVMDQIFIPPLKKELVLKEMNVSITLGGLVIKRTVRVKEDRTMDIELPGPGTVVIITINADQVRHGISLMTQVWPVPVVIHEDQDAKDEFHNYVVNYMNWYLVMLTLEDAISEGNVFITNVTLKFMIPYFYSHSVLSKYMTECIDYILKTEVTLSPRMAMRVRTSSFVNRSGRKGHNKAADMEKENQVCMLKDLIRGLGANKTESSIVKVSKSAPVVDDIAKNVVEVTETKDFAHRHTQRPIDDDLKVMLCVLSRNNPWTKLPGRKLKGFPGILESPFSFNQKQFRATVMSQAKRLRRGTIDVGGHDEIEDQ